MGVCACACVQFDFAALDGKKLKIAALEDPDEIGSAEVGETKYSIAQADNEEANSLVALVPSKSKRAFVAGTRRGACCGRRPPDADGRPLDRCSQAVYTQDSRHSRGHGTAAARGCSATRRGGAGQAGAPCRWVGASVCECVPGPVVVSLCESHWGAGERHHSGVGCGCASRRPVSGSGTFPSPRAGNRSCTPHRSRRSTPRTL